MGSSNRHAIRESDGLTVVFTAHDSKILTIACPAKPVPAIADRISSS